jgi:tyrosyl-DNA phosphodiesterase-1
MIRECWQFNYLFDVDFLMSQFDEDVRDLVSVKVVHGSWKSESDNKIRIDVSISLFWCLSAVQLEIEGTLN